MARNNIKSFSIYGLFGTSDVHIPFEEDIKILIGENGLGKTQVLNIFYYTLSRNFSKLRDFVFESLEIVFVNGDSVRLYHKDIASGFSKRDSHLIARKVFNLIGVKEFEELSLAAARGFNLHKHPLSSSLERIAPIEVIQHVLDELTYERNSKAHSIRYEKRKDKYLEKPELKKCWNGIGENFGDVHIMYFPTFRRVEEDLRNLGYNEEDLALSRDDNRLIHFGMADVRQRFDQIENNIDKLLKEGLAEFTKDILNVVIDEEATPTDQILAKINEEDLDIILSRVGKQLQTQKEAVKNIVAKKQLKNPLSAYLLQKLVDIYEKQKELDNSVKVFYLQQISA